MDEDRKEVIRDLIRSGHLEVVARTTRFSSEERECAKVLIFAQGGQKALDRFRQVVLIDAWARKEREIEDAKKKLRDFERESAYAWGLIVDANERYERRRERRRRIVRRIVSWFIRADQKNSTFTR